MRLILKDVIAVYEYASDRLGWKTEANRKYHIISYQESGSYDHTVGTRVISVKGGSLFFINKKDPYTVKCRERGQSLCVSFAGDTDLPTEAYPTDGIPGIKNIFDRMMRRTGLTESDKCLIASGIYELFSHICRREVGAARTSNARMRKINEYLAANYRRPDFSQDELTEIAGVGKAQLRKLFKSEYGTTPTQQIIDMRLGTAESLLYEGNMSISEIASFVGYDDIFYFSRLFKHRYGSSPREYKKR